MVDVSDKYVTGRTARAQTRVQLPRQIALSQVGDEIILKKGPVFQTAIIAGTMAAKKTSELIPFCHPLTIEGCKIRIRMDEDFLVTIECEVKTTGKTGVEMEALTGASVSALTIYDMVKAVSHEISIQETKLVMKTGGKRTVLDRPTYGLVLTGGKSERMKRDKALINYHGQPHALYLFQLLEKHGVRTYLSAQAGQWNGTALENLPILADLTSVSGATRGPIAGIVSAFEKHPEANWIVVACDLVHMDETVLQQLLSRYQSDSVVTCFTNDAEDFPEPLCAIYTPQAREIFAQALSQDIRCPVKVLKTLKPGRLNSARPPRGVDLSNINTPEQFQMVISSQSSSPRESVHV
ncbi:MAG: cyclic pyranopterin monophosphate synthase MoaC [Proteobacteria bacterium]|nr:MAG: cyclic pyranopterin monophosphate synthase MoaC [Pseudomonadota bacterium]